MLSELKMLKEFHAHTLNNWEDEPTLSTEERRRLRINLIVEEVHELEDAIKDNNLVEIADALIDLLYVTYGSLGEFGMARIARHLFAEVHRSNMSKLCKDMEEVRDTMKWYEEKDGTKTSFRQVDVVGRQLPMFMVYRISDGKTLKNKYYSPADIHGILETTLNRGDDYDWIQTL